jgi:hypothetical protein
VPREPQVLTEDVRRVLLDVVQPEEDDQGEAVSKLADRAETSARTVYRVLNPPSRQDGTPHRIALDLADRLMVASGHHLATIGARVWLNGQVLDYLDA